MGQFEGHLRSLSKMYCGYDSFRERCKKAHEGSTTAECDAEQAFIAKETLPVLLHEIVGRRENCPLCSNYEIPRFISSTPLDAIIAPGVVLLPYQPLPRPSCRPRTTAARRSALQRSRAFSTQSSAVLQLSISLRCSSKGTIDSRQAFAFHLLAISAHHQSKPKPTTYRGARRAHLPATFPLRPGPLHP